MATVHDARATQTINAIARVRMAQRGQQMNELATIQEDRITTLAPLRVDELLGRVQRIQQVMSSVMKDNVHYGQIPGTPRKSLWKPGAELLCVTFHIAPRFEPEDLSNADEIRYRMTCTGVHQGTGALLGQGVGEASSSEEKYKWRKATGAAEFNNTPADRKRIKYARDYQVQQVRTEPADIANTVLKMAAKRAHIAMTLNVLAASDMFQQDLEDLPEELREHLVDDDQPRARKPSREHQGETIRAPQSKPSQSGGGPDLITPGFAAVARKRLGSVDGLQDQFCKHFGIADISELPFSKQDDARAWLDQHVK